MVLGTSLVSQMGCYQFADSHEPTTTTDWAKTSAKVLQYTNCSSQIVVVLQFLIKQ